jgi:hypothetical protein
MLQGLARLVAADLEVRVTSLGASDAAANFGRRVQPCTAHAEVLTLV